MERRVLLAIFLAFLVIYTWQALFIKPVPKPAPGAGTPPVTGPASPTPAAGAGSGAPSTPAPVTPVPAEAAAPLVADTAEQDVRVETRNVIAVFTNRGARLKSWRVKGYLDQQGQPQELIEHVPNQPLPFSLRTAADPLSATLNNSLYTIAGAPAGGEIAAPVNLRFEYRDS